MKALSEIANIYPRMTSIHDSSLFDDSFAMDFINYGDKIIYCAMYLYVGWRKRSIPTHSGWLYPLTFDAEKGLKEA